jgi:catechol 2,3-dioxygenase-like lactoylglutathione lyase family enzyme
MSILFSRREALAMIAAAPAAAATAQGSQLPLKTSGLEHVGFTVPDPQAFGPNPTANPTAPARIDHFCATVEDYRLEEMRAELKTHGLNLAGQPGFNAVTDPDGIRMQFMATPGGLLQTIIPSTRVTQDDAICEAVGLDHVVLQVPDLEKSAGFYRKFFGKETSRDRTPERVWFTAARTRLGLEKMAEGQMPHIDRFGIRVAAFDRQAVARKLAAIGVTVLPSTGGSVLGFRDADGITVELRGV